MDALDLIRDEVVGCRACPRLVAWREQVAREKVARFADEPYWGRPVPGFGDPAARILILGLAPAAHGGNRTGRIFTGDRSGDFLFASLYRCGLANQATSTGRDDGLALSDVYITAVNRCAPPGNKPTPEERDLCLPFLARELDALERVRVVVALGHAAEATVGDVVLLGCFHPSQQNTFTGKLTPDMLDGVLRRAIALAT